jgi:hypothetical protein
MFKIAGTAVGLVLFAFPEIAAAQIGYLWSFEERTSQADLVVIATPIVTRETDIRTTITDVQPPFPVIEMLTEFKIALILNGVPADSTIVLRHYRPDPERLGSTGIVNGPHPLNFATKTEFAPHYLLFLNREVDGAFVPVTGQVFPEESVFLLRHAD